MPRKVWNRVVYQMQPENKSTFLYVSDFQLWDLRTHDKYEPFYVNSIKRNALKMVGTDRFLNANPMKKADKYDGRSRPV